MNKQLTDDDFLEGDFWCDTCNEICHLQDGKLLKKDKKTLALCVPLVTIK